MGRPIASIVILNNVANIVGSITVGGIAARVLGSEWLGVISALLTFLVIIFSEIIPKTLGERYAESISLSVARPTLVITFLLTPVVWVVERITAPITRGGAFPTTGEAEIKLLTQIGRQEGIIEQDEFEMIERVFRLNDVTAGDIMTPRVTMTTLPADAPLVDVRDPVIASPHSRIIVVGSDVDDVVGIVLKSELLAAIVEGLEKRPTAHFMRDVQFVPQSVQADQLLEYFRRSRQHLAVVIDEYGGVAGVVSLEDVLETLTGDIVDETDQFANLRAAARRRAPTDFADDPSASASAGPTSG
jgi:CBS domain containing-hemolysin-like protein